MNKFFKQVDQREKQQMVQKNEFVEEEFMSSVDDIIEKLIIYLLISLTIILLDCFLITQTASKEIFGNWLNITFTLFSSIVNLLIWREFRKQRNILLAQNISKKLKNFLFFVIFLILLQNFSFFVSIFKVLNNTQNFKIYIIPYIIFFLLLHNLINTIILFLTLLSIRRLLHKTSNIPTGFSPISSFDLPNSFPQNSSKTKDDTNNNSLNIINDSRSLSTITNI